MRKELVYSTKKVRQVTEVRNCYTCTLPYPSFSDMEKQLINESCSYLGYECEINDNKRRAVVVSNGKVWKIQKECGKIFVVNGKNRINLNDVIKVSIALKRNKVLTNGKNDSAFRKDTITGIGVLTKERGG